MKRRKKKHKNYHPQIQRYKDGTMEKVYLKIIVQNKRFHHILPKGFQKVYIVHTPHIQLFIIISFTDHKR